MSKHKGVPEGKRKRKKIGNVFEEIMAKNVPYLKKETEILI